MNLTTNKTKNIAFIKWSALPLNLLARYGCLACLGFSLSGCGIFFGDNGVFRNREYDYLKSDNIAPLVLPTGVNTNTLGELYPIPPIGATDFGYDPNATDYEVPRPMPLSANMLQDDVKIQRVGENSWILVNSAPGELWPRVRNFLGANNLSVAHADLKQGIIDTGWLQFKTDLSSQDKYRIQIDQGVQPETSEIHITHISVPGATAPTQEPTWPAKSMNPEREKWLLEELAATLASDTSSVGGTSMLAQGIGGNAAAKATLGMLKNEPMMTLKLDKTRAMATVAYAAKRDGFQLFESDADLGLFYVFYQNPEDAKPGWFKRFFHIGLHPKPPTTPYSLAQINANMLHGDEFESAIYSKRDSEKLLKNAPGYLIVLTGKEGDYVIRARDPYGKRLKPREARELLTILRKNLI